MFNLSIYLYRSHAVTEHPGMTFIFTIVYAGIICGVIKLINSGFFAKKESVDWDGERTAKTRPLFYYVYCLGVAVVVALIGIYYIITYKPIYLDGMLIDDSFKYIWFYVAIFLVFAGLLNSHLVVDDPSFDEFPYLRYIMKVWVTNILVTPVLVTTILAVKGINGDVISNYFLLICTSNGFGLLGFAAFAYNVHHLSQHHWKTGRKKLRIFIVAEFLTLATVVVFSLKSSTGLSWWNLWWPYALVIGLSVFYYKLEQPIPVEEAIVVEE